MGDEQMVTSAEAFWESVVAGEDPETAATRKRPSSDTPAGKKIKMRYGSKNHLTTKVFVPDDELAAFLADKPDFEIRPAKGSNGNPNGKAAIFVKSCSQLLDWNLSTVKSFYNGKRYAGIVARNSPDVRDRVAEQLLEFIDSNGGKIHSAGGHGNSTATVQAFYKAYPEAKAVVGKLKEFCGRYDAIGFSPDGRGSPGYLYRVAP